ncbi:hypothetical protein GGD41_007398 [Paraburkholderia bryophila]|uniref:Uncharacterized protein n=1 Tax=Paraburkholderia bryophila TaxID=420952 RepID=A0A7Y9WFZ4_9BURK|nr:hypothetical protein [Paraburkholderia bryophila]
MVGSDTLAMVPSSTCMNTASARPKVVSGTLRGRKSLPATAAGALISRSPWHG